MTEKIKSAIHCMRANQGIEVCEECPAYAKVGADHCLIDSCRIAEKSLQAWSEVLNECYEEQDRAYKRYCVFPTESDSATYDAYTNVIDIINQKLEGVKE